MFALAERLLDTFSANKIILLLIRFKYRFNPTLFGSLKLTLQGSQGLFIELFPHLSLISSGFSPIYTLGWEKMEGKLIFVLE